MGRPNGSAPPACPRSAPSDGPRWSYTG